MIDITETDFEDLRRHYELRLEMSESSLSRAGLSKDDIRTVSDYFKNFAMRQAASYLVEGYDPNDGSRLPGHDWDKAEAIFNNLGLDSGNSSLVELYNAIGVGFDGFPLSKALAEVINEQGY